MSFGLTVVLSHGFATSKTQRDNWHVGFKHSRSMIVIFRTEVERSMEMQMHCHVYIAVSVSFKTNWKKTQQLDQLLQL